MEQRQGNEAQGEDGKAGGLGLIRLARKIPGKK